MKILTPEQLAARIADVKAGAVQALAAESGCAPEQIVVAEVRTITIPYKLVAPDGQRSIVLHPLVSLAIEKHGPDCGPCCPHRPPAAPSSVLVIPQADGGPPA